MLFLCDLQKYNESIFKKSTKFSSLIVSDITILLHYTVFHHLLGEWFEVWFEWFTIFVFSQNSEKMLKIRYGVFYYCKIHALTGQIWDATHILQFYHFQEWNLIFVQLLCFVIKSIINEIHYEILSLLEQLFSLNLSFWPFSIEFHVFVWVCGSFFTHAQ